MKGCYTYEMPSPTATAVVGLSHRGSRVETHAAAANRKIRRREASQCGQPYSGPLGVFAVNKLEVNGCHFVDRLHYVYKDHLGSWTTITDANGNIIREQSFDAWGTMRDPDTWTGTVTQQPMFDRGFTGHEHLNSFGLINMNGRMYDPVMSSFLSVDNYVQAPDFSQSFNRYAYCLNNPLKYTDPSGEIHVLAVVAIGAAVTVITNGINNVRHGENFFHGAGQAAVTGGVQALFTYGIGESAGALARDIMELGKSAAWANVAQAGFQIVSHGTMGGMSTMSRGGKFWHGFVSSATASVMSTAINQTCIHFQLSEGLTKTAMIAGGALSGGISAKMAGGDFIDGFCNGLICSGLNHALHYVAGGDDLKLGPKLHKYIHAPRQIGSHDCKYAVMEGLAIYYGVNDMTQEDFKVLGEGFIESHPKITLAQLFTLCGFSVIGPAKDLNIVFEGLNDFDFPAAIFYKPDFFSNHEAILTGLGVCETGALMYQVSDPIFGDNHVVKPSSVMNIIQVFGYSKTPPLVDPSIGHDFKY